MSVIPAQCVEGHVKRDPATGFVALRTPFSAEDYPESSWLVASLRSGATTRPHSHVEGWDDLYVPETGSGS